MSRFHRVLLINPIYPSSHYEYINLPTGLGYVSEALSIACIPNTVVDMQLGYDISALKERIKRFDPDLIGISMMSFRYRYHYELIEVIKKWSPRIAIVAGGPHLSTLREKVMEECHSIDYGVTLEGEETIVELCRNDTPLPDVMGLLYREPSEVIKYTGDPLFITDLDTNGFPTYAQFELNKYPPIISIVSSRGCPYECIYCPIRLTTGRRFRYRTARSVADEIQYWYAKGYRDFGVADDNFTLHSERVFEICDEIERRGLTGLRLMCGNGIRADRVSRELLKRMKEVGFYYVAFGVEGGNNKILQRLKKGETIETLEQGIKDSCDLGYQVTLFFLLGSPDETESDVRDSVRLAVKYPVYDVRFYNLIPFPGTELFSWVETNHYFLQDPEKYLNDASQWINEPLFETPELPLKRRRELYAWANRRAKWHTLKTKHRFHRTTVAEKLQRLGCPALLSESLADFYFSTIFQKVFVETGVVRKVKGLLSTLKKEL